MNTAKCIVGIFALTVATSFGANMASAADLANLQVGDRIELNAGLRPSGAGGGEFLASLYDASNPPAPNSFATFCLEKNEYFSFGAPLTVVGINTYANQGGISGQTLAEPNKDYISAQTAWLYTEFRAGNLTDYNTASDGKALQNVFWYLEGEITSVTDGLTGAAATYDTQAYWATTWLNQANTNVGVNTAWGTGIGNVRVLNLQNSDGSFSQDQLYIAPIPEPEIYAMLAAGLGLMGFVARRRRKYADA